MDDGTHRARRPLGRPGLTALTAAVSLAMALAGCSSMTARHLEARAWTPGQTQTVDMKFWRFEFTAMPVDNDYGLKGKAWPKVEALPPWVVSVRDLTLAAYLVGPKGTVLAEAKADYLPMPIDQAEPVAFDFFLDADKDIAPEDLRVSFGYRASFTAAPGVTAGGQEPVFFAGEGALVRY